MNYKFILTKKENQSFEEEWEEFLEVKKPVGKYGKPWIANYHQNEMGQKN